MFAVESCPVLREIPGMGHTIRLADILAALRRLDGDDDPPRPGGVPMRLRALGRRAAEVRMMLTQAVVTVILLGHASATWVVPLIAFMSELGTGPRSECRRHSDANLAPGAGRPIRMLQRAGVRTAAAELLLSRMRAKVDDLRKSGDSLPGRS
jgi:hypothetical protein